MAYTDDRTGEPALELTLLREGKRDISSHRWIEFQQLLQSMKWDPEAQEEREGRLCHIRRCFQVAFAQLRDLIV